MKDETVREIIQRIERKYFDRTGVFEVDIKRAALLSTIDEKLEEIASVMGFDVLDAFELIFSLCEGDPEKVLECLEVAWRE